MRCLRKLIRVDAGICSLGPMLTILRRADCAQYPLKYSAKGGWFVAEAEVEAEMKAKAGAEAKNKAETKAGTKAAA
ncbi:MAG TPA: hypothetical protein PLP17_07135 [Oligoflexia bacterium]|nr:hypothetical protein [Oligoflexia bacterium]